MTANGGSVMLYLNPDLEATIVSNLARDGVETVEVEGTTIRDLMSRHSVEHVDLAKVDIEGAELELLESVDSATLRRMTQITVEFHDRLEPGQGAAVVRVKHRLQREGFACVTFSRDNSDVLFINRNRIQVGLLERAWWAARYKYPRGLRRIRRRWMDSIRRQGQDTTATE